MRDNIDYAGQMGIDTGGKTGLFSHGAVADERQKFDNNGGFSDVALPSIEFSALETNKIIEFVLKNDGDSALSYFLTECKKWLALDGEKIKPIIIEAIDSKLQELQQRTGNGDLEKRVNLLKTMKKIIETLKL